MKAKYKPKDIDRISTKLRDCIGDKKTFNFKHARPMNGIRRYWPDDKNWPGSGPIPETDLEFSEEQNDVYCHKCSSLCKPIYHLAPACS